MIDDYQFYKPRVRRRSYANNNSRRMPVIATARNSSRQFASFEFAETHLSSRWHSKCTVHSKLIDDANGKRHESVRENMFTRRYIIMMLTIALITLPVIVNNASELFMSEDAYTSICLCQDVITILRNVTLM